MTAYMTLYLSIRDAITNGVYGYGAKLPSKRQTAEAQGVSLITVAHAYDLLVEEGYVEPRERSGYFVVFREMDNYDEPLGGYRPHEDRTARGRRARPFPFFHLCAHDAERTFRVWRKDPGSFAEPWLRRAAACDRLLSRQKPPYAPPSRS